MKASRCYYCHTNIDVEETGDERWKATEDVHLARGITCIECHPNGVDHIMVRGYEGEPAAAKDAFAASHSCRGCHMGSGNDPNREHGLLGAPYPRHAGIPPIHFDKLTCTACHSGPRPGLDTRRLKNGMTHGLGEHNVNKAADALPHIYYPVFAQEDGKIAPYRLIWPAFWGTLRPRSAEPLNPEEVKRILRKAKLTHEPSADGNWHKIDQAWVEQALREIGKESGRQQVVYVAGGKLYRLNGAGGLVSEDHASAQPYLWPLAHDVRPASQALGARGCNDCHSTESAIFFGNVSVDSPLGAQPGWRMNRFEKNLDIAYQKRLAQTWVYRPWLKTVGLVAAAILLLLISGYLMKALERLAAKVAGRT